MIDLAVLVSSEFIALCQRCHVRTLDLFGSATTDRFDPARSDIDFLVTFEDVPHGKHAEAYFSLSEGLEAFLHRKIDLITEPSLQNPYLRRMIEAQKRPVFPPE